ncbi:hypothetical protein RDI58_004087 [Solanum bulbocastanum]|uniref:Retrovirus-related Pol polyprotein from transposon TNT 1-94-like beta-barrel domain-containing protein n=1 Tax=Solanum bulbocastanum TaxID=147425 RepID=A0AAN8U558_SOLBU
MTHDESLFKELKPTEISKVQIGNGDHLPVKEIGTIAIKTSTGTKKISEVLEVLYVPEIDQNLLSIGHLMEKGFRIFFEDHHCQISDTIGNEIFRVKMRGRIFSFDPTEKEQLAYSMKARCNRNLAQETWPLSSTSTIVAKEGRYDKRATNSS